MYYIFIYIINLFIKFIKNIKNKLNQRLPLQINKILYCFDNELDIKFTHTITQIHTDTNEHRSYLHLHYQILL